MKTSPNIKSATDSVTTQTADIQFKLADKTAKNLVFKILNRLHSGYLTIQEGSNVYQFGDVDNKDGFQEASLSAHIIIRHASTYRDLALNGTVGAAQAYMVGDWETPNLTHVIQLMVRNMDILNSMDDGIAKITKPLKKILHKLNQNTKEGSRKNIAAHYDLGNDLFQLFLDPTMMYSSGIFPHSESTMEEASLTKLKAICDKLKLKPEDHLVEIGTGWGSLAIYAVQNYGCKVTTTTISEQQYNYAEQRIAELKLSDKITLLKKDYRDLTEKYDKLVSVEMIEAVGYQYYPDFFSKCSQLLNDDGVMLLQAITISDQRYHRALKNVDFIQRYIFPGSCIPSITAILQTITQHTDFNLTRLDDITHHYAKTLECWQQQFTKNEEKIRALGYDDIFINMWQFYFSYCAGGFAERVIGDVHMVLEKPQSRHQFTFPPVA